MKKISIAIPTYFSSKYLSILLRSVRNSKFIDEVVISDDSNSNLEKSKIEKILHKFAKDNKSIEFRFVQNKKNLGAFNNKFNVIDLCSNDIIYQIDSDNIAAKNIDFMLSEVLHNFDSKNIYYPSILKQFFHNYQYYISPNKNLVKLTTENLKVNSKMISDSIKNDKKITLEKNIYWILNCGNFITSKDDYLDTMSKYYNNKEVPLAADALAISYLWLHSGKEIFLSKNHYHFHRKRDDSVSLSNIKESEKSFSFFREKFNSL